jgi:hypothetical protein
MISGSSGSGGCGSSSRCCGSSAAASVVLRSPGFVFARTPGSNAACGCLPGKLSRTQLDLHNRAGRTKLQARRSMCSGARTAVSTGSYIIAAAVWCTGHTQDQCVEGPPGTVTATGPKQGRYKVVAAPTIHSWHSDNTAHVTGHSRDFRQYLLLPLSTESSGQQQFNCQASSVSVYRKHCPT